MNIYLTPQNEGDFLHHYLSQCNEGQAGFAYAALEGIASFSIIGPSGQQIIGQDIKSRSITLIADDDGLSVGPKPFESPLLDARIASADMAFILAWAAEPKFYGMAAIAVALLSKRILFVETRSKHEQQWIDRIHAANPSIQFIIATPAGGNA